MAKKRYLETRTLPPAGFGGVRQSQSRVVELDTTEPAPEGAVETNEPVRDWTDNPIGGDN